MPTLTRATEFTTTFLLAGGGWLSNFAPHPADFSSGLAFVVLLIAFLAVAAAGEGRMARSRRKWVWRAICCGILGAILMLAYLWLHQDLVFYYSNLNEPFIAGFWLQPDLDHLRGLAPADILGEVGGHLYMNAAWSHASQRSAQVVLHATYLLGLLALFCAVVFIAEGVFKGK